MTFKEKIQSPNFVRNFLLTASIFFVITCLVSLILNDAKSFFSFDIDTISVNNFTEGKWKRFFGFKLAISLAYSFYLTIKKTK